MTVSFTAANAAVSVAPLDLITSALYEDGIQSAGDPIVAADAAWALEKLQRLIDSFNARREIVFSILFQQFTLTANHAPHTIGPNGDFNIPIRPVKIASASFILNSQSVNPVDLPIAIKDKEWWAANPVKSLASSISTHLYYEPAGPLGQLNFWPVCTLANPVRLELWNSLAQAIDLFTPLGFVQGYWNAIIKSLAIELGPSFGKEPSPTLLRTHNEAMRIIEANNYEPPRIETDAAMPNSRKGGRPDFNFLTGLRE